MGCRSWQLASRLRLLSSLHLQSASCSRVPALLEAGGGAFDDRARTAAVCHTRQHLHDVETLGSNDMDTGPLILGER